MMNLVGMIRKYSHYSYFLEYILLSIYTIKKTMGWCPYIKNSNSTIFQNNTKYISNEKNTIPNTIPILLEKTPLEGLTKEALIVTIFNVALVFFIVIHMISTLITYSYDSPLYYELKPELISILSILLFFAYTILHFIQSHSTIEISNNCIKVNTLFHRIAGSITHSLDSIHSIQVKDNEIYRLRYPLQKAWYFDRIYKIYRIYRMLMLRYILSIL